MTSNFDGKCILFFAFALFVLVTTHCAIIEGFDEGGAVGCVDALKEYLEETKRREQEYQVKYQKWKDDVATWENEKQQILNNLEQEWQKGLIPNSNEIIWNGNFKTCTGAASRPVKGCNLEDDFIKKCECLGKLTGCRHGSIWKKRVEGGVCGAINSSELANESNNRFGSKSQYFVDNMPQEYVNQPIEPPAPIPIPITAVCQDCRQFQQDVGAEQTTDTAIEQANQCITELANQIPSGTVTDPTLTTTTTTTTPPSISLTTGGTPAPTDLNPTDEGEGGDGEGEGEGELLFGYPHNQVYFAGGISSSLCMCCIVVIIIFVMASGSSGE